jgi:hypothetical protein
MTVSGLTMIKTSRQFFQSCERRPEDGPDDQAEWLMLSLTASMSTRDEVFGRDRIKRRFQRGDISKWPIFVNFVAMGLHDFLVPESFKEARAAHLTEACGEDVMFLSYQLSESSSSSSSAFDPQPDHLMRRKQLAATCSATFSPRLAPASPEKR